MGQQQQEMMAGSSTLRRIVLALLVAALMAAAMVAAAAPAFAKQEGLNPPGPPAISGGNGAAVLHCQPFGEGAGAFILNNQKEINNC